MNEEQRKAISVIGVFCGSGRGSREIYSLKAASLGSLLSERKITMVYGGGNIGLMGAIADSMVKAGGRVIGVITEKLVKVELAHKNIAELRIVGSMSERKNLIIDLSNAFIIMPGGYGTYDELFEVLTLCQLSDIRKPVGLFNVQGYFDHFAGMIRHSIEEGFIRPEHEQMFFLEDDERSLLDRLEQAKPVKTDKWLENFKDVKF